MYVYGDSHKASILEGLAYSTCFYEVVLCYFQILFREQKLKQYV